MDQVREQFQNLHEIVLAARAKLDRNYLGLPDRRRGDRDHGAAQPARHRLAGVPPARSAQRQRHRHQRDLPQAQVQDAGGARADRQHRAFRSGGDLAGRQRRGLVRRPDVPELGVAARAGGDREGGAGGPEDLPALRARRPGLGRGDLRPRGGGGLRRALPHRRHASLQPPGARHLQALFRGLGAHPGATRSTSARSTGRSSTSSARATRCR